MVARSVVSFGVSTERGTVHAVALSDDEAKLPDRLVIQRTFRFGGGRANLPRAVEAALEALADEIGPDREIAGAAVTYRDAAERRTIVTGLAEGPWRTASLVSAKSSHLALARAMPWTAEFDHLLMCEAVPGYQCFTLISPERDRVVAAITGTGSMVSEETMRPAVTAALDQFAAAGVEPEAVVMIGSAASDPVVTAALMSGFGVPIIPSKVASAAAAVGAALIVQPASVDLFEQERSRMSRGVGALVTAASVLVGGAVAGGIYEATAGSHPATAPVADARAAAQSDRVAPVEQPAPQSESEADQGTRMRSPAAKAPGRRAKVPGTSEPATVAWGPNGRHSHGLELGNAASDQAAGTRTSGASGLVVPDPMNPVGPLNRSLLFKGESAPPQLGSPQFAGWWDNHWRMMVLWAAEMMPRA
ncbi:hypothetical protein ABIA39_003864 [Nocardia sp. GAS34]|uniref:hypothetical protein n=1 Tax=unclassified Nocardia TaxID=2637762 RepID=UPI003D1F94EC